MGKYTRLDELIRENHELLMMINFTGTDIPVHYKRAYERNLKEIEVLERELYGDSYNDM